MTTASELIADTQPGTTWTLARDRSTVTFRNKTFWGAATVKGTFSDLDGAGEITQAHAVTGHCASARHRCRPASENATTHCGPPTSSTSAKTP